MNHYVLGRRALLSLALLSLAGLAFGQTPPRQTAKDEFRIGPEYADSPDMKEKPGVPKGTIRELTFDSKDSKYYPGIAKDQPGRVVPYQRKVLVYIPAGYVAGKAAPLLVVHDGLWNRNPLVSFLDNLIFEKRVPPMIAVMIHNGGGDSKGSQRGLEYDQVSGRYAEFVEIEVLPRVEKECEVKFTADPNGRATMGGSSGGSAALSMAWFHPEWYRRVLTYSGTYVDQQWPPDGLSPRGAWEYHATLIPSSKPKPLRLWLEVSEKDNGWDRDEASLHNWVMANERMAAVLKKKGYAYRYVFAENAGHTDGKVTRQTLGDALIWLWQGYKAR